MREWIVVGLNALGFAAIQAVRSRPGAQEWLSVGIAALVIAAWHGWRQRVLQRRAKRGAHSCAGCKHWRHEALDIGACEKRARYTKAQEKACQRWTDAPGGL